MIRIDKFFKKTGRHKSRPPEELQGLDLEAYEKLVSFDHATQAEVALLRASASSGAGASAEDGSSSSSSLSPTASETALVEVLSTLGHSLGLSRPMKFPIRL